MAFTFLGYIYLFWDTLHKENKYMKKKKKQFIFNTDSTYVQLKKQEMSIQ